MPNKPPPCPVNLKSFLGAIDLGMVKIASSTAQGMENLTLSRATLWSSGSISEPVTLTMLHQVYLSYCKERYLDIIGLETEEAFKRELHTHSDYVVDQQGRVAWLTAVKRAYVKSERERVKSLKP